MSEPTAAAAAPTEAHLPSLLARIEQKVDGLITSLETCERAFVAGLEGGTFTELKAVETAPTFKLAVAGVAGFLVGTVFGLVLHLI